MELNEKDLRFTNDEISHLMEDVFQIKIEKSVLNKIDSIIHGWITGYIFLIEKLSCMISTEEQDQYIQNFLEQKNREQFFDFLTRKL